MAWTDWHKPNSVSYYETGEIEFKGNLTGVHNITTVGPVFATGDPYGDLLVRGSNALLLSDWGFSVPYGYRVDGCELEVRVTRLARIQDRTLQLHDGVSVVGENIADLAASDRHVYGGSLDVWRHRPVDLRSVDFGSSRLGVVYDVQPHIHYPSSNKVYIRSVLMRLNIVEDTLE